MPWNATNTHRCSKNHRGGAESSPAHDAGHRNCCGSLLVACVRRQENCFARKLLCTNVMLACFVFWYVGLGVLVCWSSDKMMLRGRHLMNTRDDQDDQDDEVEHRALIVSDVSLVKKLVTLLEDHEDPQNPQNPQNPQHVIFKPVLQVFSNIVAGACFCATGNNCDNPKL